MDCVFMFSFSRYIEVVFKGCLFCMLICICGLDPLVCTLAHVKSVFYISVMLVDHTILSLSIYLSSVVSRLTALLCACSPVLSSLANVQNISPIFLPSFPQQSCRNYWYLLVKSSLSEVFCLVSTDLMISLISKDT